MEAERDIETFREKRKEELLRTEEQKKRVNI